MTADLRACLKQIGLNLKASRTRVGLRQKDIEDKIGLTYRHYQEIEAGRVNVTIDTLHRLAKLFKVELREFFR